jgi:putative hydrolase of the HAD superfamily
MVNSHLFNVIRKPKAIVFDTDNTLYPYDSAHSAGMEAVQVKAMALLNITRQKFIHAFNKARLDIKKRLQNTASSHSRLLYFQRTIENLGLGTKILLTLDLEQTYWHTFLVNMRLFQGAKDFIIQLKSDGVITANITDLTAKIQFRKLVYLGLDEYFDYVVTSEEAGKDKPHKAPIDIVLSKIGIDPAEIWMIGDNPINDIEGAFEAGMIPVQKIHNGVKISKIINEKKGIAFKDFHQLLNKYNDLEAHKLK